VNRLLSEANASIVDLAARASLAARVEPSLLRALRLEITPQLDAGVEGDLWFSALVHSRGVDGFTLRTDVLDDLREQLKRDEKRLRKVWEITERLHRGISPAVKLEEDIAWLAVTAGAAAPQQIDAKLQSAVVALLNQGREGVAAWALRALPRMPRVARDTTAAWTLALGTARVTGKRPPVGDTPPSNLLDVDLQKLMPASGRAEVGVVRRGGHLFLGEPSGAKVRAIEVPDLNPRYIEVRNGDQRRVFAVPAGQTVAVDVQPGPISLRATDFRVYDVPAEPPINVMLLGGVLQLREAFARRPDLIRLVDDPGVSTPMDVTLGRSTVDSIDLFVIGVGRQIESDLRTWMMREALSRAQQHHAWLIPVILETANWQSTPLINYQALPRDLVPISERKDADQVEVVRAVAEEIVRAAEQVRDERTNTLTVSAAGDADYRTIGAALEHAATGTVVVVRAGTYREQVKMRPGVTVRGDDVEKVVIDGGGRGWVVGMANDAILRNCTIRGGGKEAGVNDCGVMVDGCTDVVVTENRIVENGHYGVILRRCDAEVSRNTIERNDVLGIYLDEGAQFDITQNVIANHRHSALDIVAADASGQFRRNTVAGPGDTGITEGNGRSPEIEVVNNIFSNLKTGIHATRTFAPHVKSNLFSKTDQPFFDWDKNRPVKLEAGNIVADAQFVSGTYRLAPGSPAIGAASDHSDIGALPFEAGASSPAEAGPANPPAKIAKTVTTAKKKMVKKKAAKKR
jgi:Periplasmic copper-binding protein (NosD)